MTMREQELPDLTSIVELAQKLYAINQEVADLYYKATSGKMPCGYSWTTIKLSDGEWVWAEVDDEEIGTKDGQSSTGDVKHRIKAFESKHPQLIVDVLIDPFFIDAHADKKINEWRDDHEDGAELDRNARSVEAMKIEIAKFQDCRINRRIALKKLTGNPLAGSYDVFLGTAQWEKLAYAIRSFKNGSRSILADLCARFGKTIWAGAVADMSGAKVVIIASYVKTAFTSFRTDLMDKRQFIERFVHINTEDENWKLHLTEALNGGMRALCYVSLCQGSNRQDRINFIGSLSTSRLWIVDEADFGAHQKKQVDALMEGVKIDDLLILMTGTNADVAVRKWSNTRKFTTMSCTYAELLIQKQKTKLELMQNA